MGNRTLQTFAFLIRERWHTQILLNSTGTELQRSREIRHFRDNAGASVSKFHDVTFVGQGYACIPLFFIFSFHSAAKVTDELMTRNYVEYQPLQSEMQNLAAAKPIDSEEFSFSLDFVVNISSAIVTAYVNFPNSS